MESMEFIAQMQRLPSMIGFVVKEAKDVGIEGERLNKIELATEEALVNVIHYAYSEPEREENRLHMTCNFLDSANQFVVTIKDFGKPFNLKEKEVDLQLGVPVEERKIGGLGIYMIKQLATSLDYERKENENILSMVF